MPRDRDGGLGGRGGERDQRVADTLAQGAAYAPAVRIGALDPARQRRVGAWDKRLILSAVLLLTIIFTELLSNNAVAALLAPFAIQMGVDMGVDPRPFIVAVMIGASIGFAIPAGYQTHMMVYSAGGYRFTDFIRVGVPLDILLWILGSIFIPIFFPF